MKKFILASVLTLAATAAVIAPTQAASLVIQSDDDNQYSDDQSDSGIVIRRHHHRHYNQYGDENVQYDDYGNGDYRRYHRRHRCHIETVVHWRHHHRVIEDVRVCG
ncbi:hypothetical protein FJ938_00685 [Mesorhizobium sp. B2-4-14]|uniref:hypothetical protein n=1 Tax=Mesorhizobium sp. B2-4-14 TaxID=2589935 RepID=UPI00112A88E2|nr:hypothetical protein [Mesorhizobium sp. B2-4-14]TPL12420.1 hypothetical protein FJ938_00685 [Mesorhizobium sp. B2-4-14]